MKQIRIAIADDHELVSQSFAMALKSDPIFQVCGLARNGRELLDIIATAKPDVVLLDLNMPVLDGWGALEMIKKYFPTTRVIIVSMHFHGLLIEDLVKKGAHGFLPKSASFQTLAEAIMEVHQLGYYFNWKINKKIVAKLFESQSITPNLADIHLNELELRTLLMVCEDKLTKEIAEELHTTVRTAERIKVSLYEKTGSKTSAGLMLYALQKKLIAIKQ